MEQNFICVKWGTKYPAEEVNALFSGVKRNTEKPARFFCLTDDPVGLASDVEILSLEETPLQIQISEAQTRLRRSTGALRKISVFDPELIPDLKGSLMCLDIDILITGNLDGLFQHAPDKVCMPRPFKAKSHIETKGEGSVIRFDPKQHNFLFDDMATKTAEMLEFSMGSEQRYTSFAADRNKALAHFPLPWVVSFMRHCRPVRPMNLVLPPREPKDARIICFPSEPKAKDAVGGYRRGLKSTRPAPWVKRHL